MRREALDDLEFSVGDQWPSDIKADRQLSGRPCLTVNVLGPYIKHVTNEQRAQRPAGTINPVGSGADIDTAEILQGIVRHIEVNSDAEVADDYAFEYMVRIGFGFERLDTGYINGEKDQEIFVSLIRNPFCVYIDPNSQKLDRSDAKWGFQIEDVPFDEFKETYPDSAAALGSATLQEYSSVGDQPAAWASTAGPLPTIRVAEYWYKEKPGDRLFKWAKISALDILDKEETVWEQVPLLGIYGTDLVVNGRMHQSGLVRFAKDPQRAKNYWTSAATEMIALAPKAPWVAAVGTWEEFKAQYEQSNYRNIAVLPYNPVSKSGTLLPPPARQAVEPPIQAMQQLLQMSTIDLQAVTGLNDANLGLNRKADESGKAVLARQRQGSMATADYSDNLSRMIRRRTRMILQSQKRVYTEPRIQRIIKPDGTVKQVGIYNSANDNDAADALEKLSKLDDTITKIYDIGTGEYDVTISVGPSYQTKRQEAVETQIQLLQLDPQIIPYIGDIVVGNMDIPGAQEIAKRLKKLLPPALQEADDPEQQQQMILAQHGQLVQQVQLLSQQLQMANQTIQTKKVEQDGKFAIENLKAESDLKLQNIKIAADIVKAQIAAQHQDAQARQSETNQVWSEISGQSHEAALTMAQQAHEKAMAQLQGAQQAQQQTSDQAHEANMAGAQQSHEVGMAAMQQQNEQPQE